MLRKKRLCWATPRNEFIVRVPTPNMVKRSTLKDQIKALLIKRILEGTYRSGDRLVELKIAREMGTSQAPVREALRELVSLRLVENVPHKGTRVRSLGKQELLETFLVRGALEECAT